MKTDPLGIQFTTGFEGFRSCPYQLGDGVTTQGFGSTHGIKPGDKCWSRAQALARFARDLSVFEQALNRAISRYNLDLSAGGQYDPQKVYDAFISFIYNLGSGMLEPSHDFGRHLSQRSVSQAIASMDLYIDKGSQFEKGLQRRRDAEQALARTAVVKLTHDEILVKDWEARLVRLRATSHKLGHWTPGRKALAEELKKDIRGHTKGHNK